MQTLYGHSDIVISAVFSPDGKEVLSASNDQTVRLWNLGSDDNSKILVKNDTRLFSSVIDPNNKLIAARCEDSTVRVWDMESGKEKLRLRSNNQIGSVAINPSGKQLAYVSYYVPNMGKMNRIDTLIFIMSLHLYDLEKGEVTKTICDSIDGFEQIAYSLDGKKIVFTTQQHYKIKMLDLETDSIIWVVPRNGYGCVRFSPDGKSVLYASYTPYVIDAATGVCTDKHDCGIARDAKYSPDGRFFATAVTGVNSVKIWDAENGKCVKTLKGNDNGVRCVCFSPDGKYVVSGSQDKTIRVWELQSGVCVCLYKGHDASISDVSFSSDGNHIISISDDYVSDDWSVRKWDFPPLQDLIDQTRERFKDRPLTPEERRMYYLE